MTVTPPTRPGRPAATSDEGTSTSPTALALWRTARGPVGVGVLVLLLAVLLTYAASTRTRGDLDPRSAGPEGSLALATLLARHGVDVELVRTATAARDAATDGATLLVAVPDLLDADQRGLVADVAADVVLVRPGPKALTTFAPGVEPTGSAPVETRDPSCALDAARAAGPAETGGLLYRATTTAREGATLVASCYAAGGRASLVHLERGGRAVTVLGSADALTNDRLEEQGNAALTLRVLGRNPRLVWYLPDPVDSFGGEERSFTSLLPDQVRWVAIQLGAAAVLFALWRARRLGPVVAEPLPVVVRAAETVEGRAHLYRRARARDRAADALRAASRDRLVPLLGLPRAVDPSVLVEAVAARTGRPPVTVGALLYGAAPVRDADLVHLAAELDTLEGEVRKT